MIRSYCDICEEETTTSLAIHVTFDKSEEEGRPHAEHLSPTLHGKLRAYNVCQRCAIRMLDKPVRAVSK